ncbi:MAG: pentapeptide repeat-containing protein [Chroococcales cyanobacterium]
MKSKLLITATLLTTLSLPTPAQAENLKHLNQLLNTKQCPGCDLINAGLVMSDLSGADLRGANLTRANLSRANLAGADLTGANLSGASLNGANLTGAILTDAVLTGADIRDTYLMNANLSGVNLDTAYVQGVMGMPTHAGTPEQFQSWAVIEGNRGNYRAAIEYYNQALNIDSNFADAYLGRGLARYRLGDEAGAYQDAQIAAKLFEEQQNAIGYQTAQSFVEGIEMANNPDNKKKGGGGFQRILTSVGSLLLRFLMR